MADHSAGRVSGTVLLSPKLAAGPGDVLYLIAKQGPTTLAVRRIDKPVFPFEFELTGDDAMVSDVPFVGPVDLVARVSRTGDAIPAKGDLEGVIKGLAVPASRHQDHDRHDSAVGHDQNRCLAGKPIALSLLTGFPCKASVW